MDMASGYTVPELIKKHNISYHYIKKLKQVPINRYIIQERKRAIKQTVMRVFGKFDSDYELMVEKYMQRLLEDERINRTSLMALAGIVDTFANIYKKVSEIDNFSKKQILDIKRYKLEKQHFEILKKMKIGNDATDEGTPNSIIANFYEKLNEMATDDFKQKDIELSKKKKKEMLEIDLSKKNANQLKEIQRMVNKQLELIGEKRTEAENKEIVEKRHVNETELTARMLEQKRELLKDVGELNTNEKLKKSKRHRERQKTDVIYEEQQRQKEILQKHLENSENEEIE